MEPPGARVVRPANEDGVNNPNHLIIWLDRYIGKPEQCVLLHRAFFMTADPTTGYEVNLNEDDIDKSARLGTALHVSLNGIQFMLRAFENIETCFEGIKNNLDKRIFFITSGSLGKIIVPSLLANFPETFVEEHPIYIFCAKMNMVYVEGVGDPTNDWAFDYIDNVLMYNHQSDLLARLVLDIAKYFFAEAERLEREEQLRDARQHYHWSKRMWQRYETMEKKKFMTSEIDKIDQRVGHIEQRLKQQNKSAADPTGEPPA